MSTMSPKRSFRSRLNFRNWRISTKLLVVMVTLALVPIILVTVISTQTWRDALVYEAQVNLTRLANSTAQRFDQLLIDNQNYIELTAGQGEVISYLTTSDQDRSPDMYAALNQEINLLLNANDLINLVSVFDQLGIVKAHTDPQYVDQNYFFRDYVQFALAGQPYTGGITIGVRDNKPGVISSTPIYDENDNVVGAISARVKGDYITYILESTLDLEAEDLAAEDLAQIDIYLVNEFGIVMSHSDPNSNWLYRSIGEIESQSLIDRIVADKLLGGDCPAGDPNCDADDKIARQPDPMLALGHLRAELMAALSAGETGTYIYCRPTDLDVTAITPESCPAAQNHIIGYAPVYRPGADHTDKALFMVVVDVPGSIFSEDVAAFVQQGFIVALVVGLIGLLIALLVARMLAKPILRLAEAAQDVEDDKPFHPQDISEVISMGDELGHLARVFSNMVMALRARMAELRTIYEIGQEISASVELEETLNYILGAIRAVIPYDAAELCFYDAEQRRMVVRAAANQEGVRYYEPEMARFYSADQGFLAHLRRTGRVLSISDLQGALEIEPDPSRKWAGVEPRSYLGVALRSKGKVIGTIELVSKDVNSFSPDNRRLLESIALQASIEVQNAQEVQERERRLAQQIQQMEIVIDGDKKQQQIAAIEETEFFQEALRKARQARK